MDCLGLFVSSFVHVSEREWEREGDHAWWMHVRSVFVRKCVIGRAGNSDRCR